MKLILLFGYDRPAIKPQVSLLLSMIAYSEVARPGKAGIRIIVAVLND